jgi:phosphonate transport system substrate-binding protein
VLWKSPLIPSDPLVWRKDIDPELKDKLKAFFYAYGTKGPNAEAERKHLLGIQEWIGFKPSSNAQLVPIRQLDLFREKTKLASDTTTPAGEKQTKIAEIDKKLAELNAQLAK